MIGRNRLVWKDNKLYCQDQIMCSVEEEPTKKHMFWVVWPDGQTSADFYNKTRAKDHCYGIALKTLNNEVEEDE